MFTKTRFSKKNEEEGGEGIGGGLGKARN